MKNFILGILFTVFLVVVGFFAYQYGFNQKEKTTVSEKTGVVEKITPTTEPVVVNEDELIKEALLTKHNWKAEDMMITISKNDGQYASGGVREKSYEVGGGYFYAVKDNGIWKIVADGNGTISCASLEPYPDYPVSMIPECYNETTGQSVKR